LKDGGSFTNANSKNGSGRGGRFYRKRRTYHSKEAILEDSCHWGEKHPLASRKEYKIPRRKKRYDAGKWTAPTPRIPYTKAPCYRGNEKDGEVILTRERRGRFQISCVRGKLKGSIFRKKKKNSKGWTFFRKGKVYSLC